MKYTYITMDPMQNGVVNTLLDAFEVNKNTLKAKDPQVYYALLDLKDSVGAGRIKEGDLIVSIMSADSTEPDLKTTVKGFVMNE